MNLVPDFDYLYKIALLGDASVGKTNLILRFTEKTFSLNITPTVGYDYKSKTITLDKYNKKVSLQIWDTAGQERFMALSKTIYKIVDGVILVYDITKLITFENILNWMKKVKEYNKNLPILIIGNKKDKEEDRNITFEEGKKFAEEHQMGFFETSAFTGENVNEAFISFIYEIMELKHKTSLTNNDSFSIETKKKKKEKCCK